MPLGQDGDCVFPLFSASLYRLLSLLLCALSLLIAVSQHVARKLG